MSAVAKTVMGAVGVKALDHAIDEAALRLADVIRASVDQLVRFRGAAIAADVDAFRLRHPGLDDASLGRALTRDTRWRGTARSAISGIPSLFPGIGTAIALGVSIADAAATVTSQSVLALGLLHLAGLDVTEVEERRTDLLLILGLEAGVLEIKDGRLLHGDDEIGKDGVIDDALLARLSRGIGEQGVKRVVARRAGVAVGRLAPFGIGVAVAAGSGYRAATAASRATRRYLAWKHAALTAAA